MTKSIRLIFTPRDYEDIPFVKIELKNFDFHRHSKTCKDCGAFINAFGTNSIDWFINYSGKTRRLDLSYFGSEFSDNHSQFKMSEFGNISILKLNLSTLPDSREELNAL